MYEPTSSSAASRLAHLEPTLPSAFRAVPDLDEGWSASDPSRRLAEIRERARTFHHQLRHDGPVRAVRTFDLAFLPYPVQYAFWHAAPTKRKWLVMRNRMNVVEFEDFEGKVSTLLVNPSEHDLALQAPFFEHARKELMPLVPAEALKRIPGPVPKLRAAGIDPAKVDYITFDHLHVQDLRRSLVGEGGHPPLYPNARLIVNRRELETVADPHPLQRPWYIPAALDGVPAEKLIVLEGSAWLGKGLALAWTPGHTRGNHSIAINVAGRGVFAISENGVCVDSYVPRYSAMESLREYAKAYDVEVVMNGNSLEETLDQYTSMVLEKELVDWGDAGDDVPNIFNSSPLVANPLVPGVKSAFRVADLEVGILNAAAR